LSLLRYLICVPSYQTTLFAWNSIDTCPTRFFNSDWLICEPGDYRPKMFSIRNIASFALAAFLFSGSSAAAHHAKAPRFDRRQESSSSVNGTTTSLEPVVPPDVNEDALSILALDTNVTLAWAGSTSGASSGSKRMLKRDGGVFSSAAFTFAHPAVPLDHSSYISGVACSDGSLTGVLIDSAYAYAKKQWTGASNILFVTSVPGCGMDDANEFFHATSITFDDSQKTFTAKGSSTGYKDVAVHMNLKWGDVGAMKLKRTVDKREVRILPPAEIPFSEPMAFLRSSS
jgi:hypothetical protein